MEHSLENPRKIVMHGMNVSPSKMETGGATNFLGLQSEWHKTIKSVAGDICSFGCTCECVRLCPGHILLLALFLTHELS